MMEARALNEIPGSLFSADEFRDVPMLKPFFMRDKMEKSAQAEDH